MATMPEPRSTPRAVTIYDVAEKAGVSASTVSRAFSRPERVSFDTAEKIRSAALALGYGTRIATRSGDVHSPRPTTGTLGLVVADAMNPFFQEIRRGADHAAGIENVVVLTADIRESARRATLAVARMTPLVDALLLASSRLSNGEIQKIARGLPTVVINRPVPGVPSVVADSYTGTIRAATHLHEQGARTITYLAGPEDSWTDSMRWRALLDVTGHAPAGGEPLTRFSATETPPRLSRLEVDRIRLDEPSIRGGARAFSLWSRQRSDAVLCFNDLVAIGFMAEAARHGVDVPGDVLVVGYDNTQITTLVSPTLTTVAGPLRSVGRVAAANALALARGLKTPMTRPRVLPTRLIVRESSTRLLPG